MGTRKYQQVYNKKHARHELDSVSERRSHSVKHASLRAHRTGKR